MNQTLLAFNIIIIKNFYATIYTNVDKNHKINLKREDLTNVTRIKPINRNANYVLNNKENFANSYATTRKNHSTKSVDKYDKKNIMQY